MKYLQISLVGAICFSAYIGWEGLVLFFVIMFTLYAFFGEEKK